MHRHAIGDNTTKRFMAKSVSNGFQVWFRFHRMTTTHQAEVLESTLIHKFWWRYPWNKVGSPWHPIHPPR